MRHKRGEMYLFWIYLLTFYLFLARHMVPLGVEKFPMGLNGPLSGSTVSPCASKGLWEGHTLVRLTFFPTSSLVKKRSMLGPILL